MSGHGPIDRPITRRDTAVIGEQYSPRLPVDVDQHDEAETERMWQAWKAEHTVQGGAVL